MNIKSFFKEFVMKNILIASTLILSGLVFSGCGPQNQSDGNVNPVAYTASTNMACPTGYWYSNGYCTNGTNTIGANYNLNQGFYADNYSGYSSLRMTDQNKMREFFKLAMGVCDRGAANYQNIGQANCSYYLSGYMDIILQFPQQMNGNAIATFIARPRQNPYVNYTGQLPSGWGLIGAALGYLTGGQMQIPDPSYYSGAYRNPLQLQMTVTPTNNSQGFEARAYGDAWTGANQTLITLQVLNGSVNSTNLNYTMIIGNTPAATGTMSRCQSQNCGL
jgi:hypothetical protein